MTRSPNDTPERPGRFGMTLITNPIALRGEPVAPGVPRNSVEQQGFPVTGNNSRLAENSAPLVENSPPLVENLALLVENLPPLVENLPSLVENSPPLTENSWNLA